MTTDQPNPTAPLRDAQVVGRRLAHLLRGEMPPGWGFVLVLANFGPGGEMTYISSLDRPGAVELLQELARKIPTEGSAAGRPRSFYIAAGCARFGVARARGILLSELLGYEWEYDWTPSVEQWGALAAGQPQAERAAAARADLQAATKADLFVALLDGEAGLGTYAELGARLASGKVAHVVGGEDHLFFAHPLVMRHDTWRSFLTWLALYPVAGTTPLRRHSNREDTTT